MKRRTFIFLAAGAAAITILPLVRYKQGKFTPDDPLLRPEVLARFCDEKEICAIGKSYRSLVPVEDNKKKLEELILTNNDGKKESTESKSAISTLIEEKIRQDFEQGRTVVADGWIISETEARQCALVSIAIN